MIYTNFVCWLGIGVFCVLKFFFWTIWKYIVLALWHIGKFIVVAIGKIYIAVHSHKRVLCAIDGTLGGAISYLWLAHGAGSFAEQAMIVIFGGMIGATIGVLSWEIISKRVLHLVEK